MTNKKAIAFAVLLCFMVTLFPVAAFADTTTSVATYEELQEALLQDGSNIQLTKTVVVTSSSVTLDLKGKTITAAENVDPLFRIQADDVTVKNGTVDARNGVAYAFIVGTPEKAANLTIESGSYYGEVSAVSVTKGSLTVNDGEFAVNPYKGSYAYLLNCIDANYKDDTANIIVNGGTFHNFNPADNAAEGPETSFVPAGYFVNETAAGMYEVLPVNILKALDRDINLPNGSIVIEEDMVIDLNGHTVKAVGNADPLFRIQADNVTVKNGTVDARNGVAYAFIVGTPEKAANLIIESGTYYGETSAVSVTKGSLTVNGGEFAVNPYLDNYTYLLNCIDANYQNDTADIIVKGGTFHNYNPADNEAEGPGTDWVPEGYAAVNTENVWCVIQTAVSGITLDKTTASVNTGKNINLTATVTPDTALDKEVIWASDNTDIATVENGVVTGVKAGSAVITATTKDGGYTAQCTVTVTKPYTGSSGFSGSYNYPVKVESTKDAEVVLSDNNASKGETVTITVKPEAGKDVKDVIITDANGNVIPVIKTADNQYTFVMPEGKVNISPATENADYDSKIVLQIGNRSTAVNGEEFSNDVAPVIIGDRTMVPIRVIIESLGGAADWDEATRTVTLTIGGQVLRMVIDEIIDGFDAAPMIMNGRTYVPVRYIAEAVGAQVEWIEASQQIVIKN